jgi:hypothetical protein
VDTATKRNRGDWLAENKNLEKNIVAREVEIFLKLFLVI